MGEALTGSTLTERFLTKQAACAFCAIACKRVVEVKEGPFAVPEGPGPEYETIVALGSLIGSWTLPPRARRACLQRLGWTQSPLEAAIAWAMEALERGAMSNGGHRRDRASVGRHGNRY